MVNKFSWHFLHGPLLHFSTDISPYSPFLSWNAVLKNPSLTYSAFSSVLRPARPSTCDTHRMAPIAKRLLTLGRRSILIATRGWNFKSWLAVAWLGACLSRLWTGFHGRDLPYIVMVLGSIGESLFLAKFVASENRNGVGEHGGGTAWKWTNLNIIIKH